MTLENEMYLREGITTSIVKPRNRSDLAVARKVITTNKNYSPASDFCVSKLLKKNPKSKDRSLSAISFHFGDAVVN